MSRHAFLVRTLAALGCCLIALSASCPHLPDVGPFVDTTVEMRSALRAGGDAVEAELRLMKGGEPFADQVKEQWTARIQASDALVEYANALSSIVESGKTGKEAAGSLASSLTDLATSAGLSIPAAGAVLTDTASFVYGQIALVRAAKNLEAALTEAQPAVAQITTVIAKDLKDLAVILQAASQDVTDSAEIEMQVEIGFRNSLLAEQKKLYALPVTGGDGSAGAPTMTDDQRARLVELGQLLEATRVWYDPLQNQLAEARRRYRLAQSIISAAGETTILWGDTHQNLVLAVQEKRPISVQGLLGSAQEIRDLINRMREI